MRANGRGAGRLIHHCLRGASLGGVALLVAIMVAYLAQAAVERLAVWGAVVLVALLAVLGALADLVGVAVAAADEPSLHAMAAKRRPGARGALTMKRHADRVAVVLSDIVGDVVGTVGAAAAAAIAVRLAARHGWSQEASAAVAVGAVASLMVGGKAFAKGVALERANHVLTKVGRVWHWFGGSGRRGR